MKIRGVVKIKEIATGITHFNYDLNAEEVVALISELSKYSGILNEIPHSNFDRGVLVNAEGWQILINFAAGVTLEDFKMIYGNIDHSAFDIIIRKMRSDHLSDFLKSQGVRSITTLSKDDIIAKICGDASLMYKILVGSFYTSAPGIQYCDSINVGTDKIYFRANKGFGPCDFWKLSGHTSMDVTTNTTAAELEDICKSSSWTMSLSRAEGIMPKLSFENASLDFNGLKYTELAEKYNQGGATNTRDGTIKRVFTHNEDILKAKKLNGKRIFFSFTGPVVLGKPLNDTELLAIAKYIRIVGSTDNIYEGIIEDGKSRSDFEQYFLAKEKVWAVLAEINLE